MRALSNRIGLLRISDTRCRSVSGRLRVGLLRVHRYAIASKSRLLAEKREETVCMRWYEPTRVVTHCQTTSWLRLGQLWPTTVLIYDLLFYDDDIASLDFSCWELADGSLTVVHLPHQSWTHDGIFKRQRFKIKWIFVTSPNPNNTNTQQSTHGSFKLIS